MTAMTDGDPGDGGPPVGGAHVFVPEQSRIPPFADGDPDRSTAEDYDTYFRLTRSGSGLAAWSRTCLEVGSAILRDLDNTVLDAEERYAIARGLLIVQQVTLDRWVSGSATATGDGLGQVAP
jgi:hypothetical protein